MENFASNSWNDFLVVNSFLSSSFCSSIRAHFLASLCLSKTFDEPRERNQGYNECHRKTLETKHVFLLKRCGTTASRLIELYCVR